MGKQKQQHTTDTVSSPARVVNCSTKKLLSWPSVAQELLKGQRSRSYAFPPSGTRDGDPLPTPQTSMPDVHAYRQAQDMPISLFDYAG
jgi:hypothetical protein